MPETTLIWFRRNLRLADNAALAAALQRGLPVAGVWLQEPSETVNTRQARFLYQSAAELHQKLAERGIPLYAAAGRAEDDIPRLAAATGATAVVADEAYTPSEILADNHLWRILDAQHIPFIRINDRTVFAKSDIADTYGGQNPDFQSYRRAWLAAYTARFSSAKPSEKPPVIAGHIQTAFNSLPPFPEAGDDLPALAQTGGEAAAEKQWTQFAPEAALYPLLKDFPARKGSSRLSAYLAAGCISPRVLAAWAWQHGHHAWLETLIKRDFYYQQAFRLQENGANAADTAAFQTADADYLQRWQSGQTGFPLIDAAMRVLAQSGNLPPALRDMTARFWCTALAQPWQAGAAWFAAQLTDYDPAVNVGNWQTAAADTRPFSPVLQSRRLDPDGMFIRRHVPEIAHLPQELVHTPHLAGANAETNGYPAPLLPL
ncbi:FAD-binding domain-containing protein [Bergeriella denitrificans]|uniref:Deoxyribodopyrimidine photolyase n=1 Tax=Bergeriella denitrificans TaxID=494 RepID=A0A378UL56_BERDE|nr:FAD-binding domain-containing protein [Bergeriella denitrificans]STZ77423.1 deoxyribodopyrimidine photolyase [Bergeriella denitrificans]